MAEPSECDVPHSATDDRVCADLVRSSATRCRCGVITRRPLPCRQADGISPRLPHNAELPELATIAAILDDSTSPHRYRRVTINGCYTVDPYHGAVLVDNSGRGLMWFGGSDDVGDQPFDWTCQKVCGTFVATIYREPRETPLKYLCPEVCAVGEGTVASTIVEIDNQTAIEAVR
jgi:hypothetical protein